MTQCRSARVVPVKECSLLRTSFPKSAAKLVLIFSAKVQKMHFALREFFTLLDKLYAIFRTNRSTYVGY